MNTHGNSEASDRKTVTPPTWTATLNATRSSITADIGYGPDNSDDSKFGSLTDDSFSVRGIAYTVLELHVHSFEDNKDDLTFRANKSLPADVLSKLKLTLNNTTFNGSDASPVSGKPGQYEWDNSGLDWEGFPSVAVSMTVKVAPEAPAGFQATPGDGQVMLSWDASADPSIIKYQYQYVADVLDATVSDWIDIDDSAAGGANATSFTLGSLTNGVNHTFIIKAVNDVGASLDATERFAMPNPTPDTPTGLRGTAGDGEVTLHWDDPNDPDITKYQYEQFDDALGSEPSGWMDISDSAPGGAHATSFTVDGLNNSLTYTFKIRAATGEVVGEPSDAVVISPNSPPTFDEGEETTRTIAENEPVGTLVGARVTAMDDDVGDVPVYSIARNDDDAFVVNNKGQLRTVEILNYEEKSFYSVTLRVEDSLGASDTIDVSITVTDVNDSPIFVDGESTIRRIAENSPQGTNVGAAVVATDDDDVPIYAIYSDSVYDLNTFRFDFVTGQFSVDWRRLDHEVKSSYSFRLRAYDDDDASAYIDVTIEIIDVPERPRAPTGLVITPAAVGGETTLIARWNAPNNTLRPPILGYSVRYQTGSTQYWITRHLGPDQTNTRFVGLIPGATYTMQVLARNDDGNGPWSSRATGSTIPEPPEEEATPEPTAEPTPAPTAAPTLAPSPTPPPAVQEILEVFEESPEQAGELVGQIADDDPEEAGDLIAETALHDLQATGLIVCEAAKGHAGGIGLALGHGAGRDAGTINRALGTVAGDGDCVSQLGGEIPVGPWIPEQPPQEGQDPTGEGEWQDVGSPAPVENVLARFFNPMEGAKTNIVNHEGRPAGTEPLPPERMPYAFVDIGHENFDNEDVVTAHATISVEKEWLTANQVHQWSVQFSRYNDTTSSWTPTQAKRVNEDDAKVYFTVTVPGFSLWAIHGSTEAPAAVFDEDNLSVAPLAVNAGQLVVVSVDVTNKTVESATYFANLWVDSQISRTDEVVIRAGQTTTVNLPLIVDAPGSYQIRIGSQILDTSLIVIVPGLEPTVAAPAQVATPTQSAPPTVAATVESTPAPAISPTLPPTLPPTMAPSANPGARGGSTVPGTPARRDSVQ